LASEALRINLHEQRPGRQQRWQKFSRGRNQIGMAAKAPGMIRRLARPATEVVATAPPSASSPRETLAIAAGDYVTG